MSTAAAETTACVAMIGNPNTGKSTVFAALSGVYQRVGNYPGVTVEKKIGQLSHAGRRYTLVDLPGTYSLAPRSPDEMVAVDVLLGRHADVERPTAVLCIVDASNLDRNLYLVSQVLELGLPTVLALNMIDVATERGIEIDIARLERQLGVRVVPIQAHRRVGLDALKSALAAMTGTTREPMASPFPEPFQAEVAALGKQLNDSADQTPMPRYLVERLLLDTSGYLEQFVLNGRGAEIHEYLQGARQRLSQVGCPVPAIEAMSRYAWVGRMLDGAVRRPTEHRATFSDRLDRVLTNRLWGSLAFMLMMFVVFQAVFRGATPAMDLIEACTGWLGETIGKMLPDGALRSLVVDGVIAGVGGVLIFLPQILILFFFIAVLEDCGYMARSAYLMDRLMTRVGLSGKSFIPLLSSFACAIPGVMATRVIENRRDRLTTILVAPLMSCSARLPVYTLLIAAFIPQRDWLGGVIGLQGMVMMGMYLVGMLAGVVVALILKKTLLRGPTPPFVLELPSYKWPSLRTVFYRMTERGWSFVQRAGTLIVAVSIVVWAALYYPHNAEVVEAPYAARRAELTAAVEQAPADSPTRTTAEESLQALENEIAGAYRRQSILGRLGHVIEPAVRPLGWDWRIGCAALASFPAREVVVATLGIIYNLGEGLDPGSDEDRGRLQAALQDATWDGTDRKVFTIPVALSIMVFFALCAQCASTLVVIKRETNSWRWPTFAFVYMTALAYVGSFVTYQVTRLWL